MFHAVGCSGLSRRSQFHKRSQQFTSVRNETLSVAMRVCEVRPSKDKHGVDLISDALPLGRLFLVSNALAGSVGWLPPPLG
jgi:hypothetical protein